MIKSQDKKFTKWKNHVLIISHKKKNRNIDKNISVFEESNVFSKMKKFRDEKDGIWTKEMWSI